ncbi:MAG: STAS domain-containing protein [Planctomycetes bacterium]|nr:STAS domain-containing protein [Planctomycetota bacterium]
MEKLIRGLRHFRQNLLWERKEIFERSVRGQRPLALLITCSDSRVLPDTLMQSDPGDLFVSRNAGNLVPLPDTPGGEGATVEYAVTALGVTDIIVCGHYRCGAVKALLNPADAREMPRVAAWLSHADDVCRCVRRDHPSAEGDELWDRAVERNVLVQLENLSKHPVVAAGLPAGTLRLHAWVLRFESSEVLAYDPCVKAFSPLLEMQVVHPAMPISGPDHADAPAIPSGQAPQPARKGWVAALWHDLPASLVVFLVALPLCLAIARTSGLPTEAGIITGVVGGIVVGLLGGSPLQVSGPTVTQVVILISAAQRFGPESLGIIILLAGLLQLVAGFCRLGQLFRAVSPAVVVGMLAGIGVVIFAQQFHVVVDDPPHNRPLTNLVSIPQAVWWSITDAHHEHPEHQEAALIGLLTLASLLIWPVIARWRLQAVPAVLVAIVLATTMTAVLGWSIQRVTFEGLSSAVRLPDPSAIPRLATDVAVWLTAATIALVASAETLLSAAAIDQMHRGSKTRYDRELAAQGVGNAVCGLLGALPVTGVIVRSATNVRAGARTRLSAVFHGVWLLAFVLVAPGLLRLIPTAALAAILVLVGVRLVDVRGIRSLWRQSRSEAVICVATAATVVIVDLLTGVALGVGLSVAKLIHTFSRLRVRRRVDEATGRVTLVLEGSATFLRLPRLAAALERVPLGSTLHVDLTGLSYIDHACMDLLANWERQHEATGGKLVLDWETLRARFHTARPRPRTTA